MELKKFASGAVSGLVSAGMPFMFKGAVNEWLEKQVITPEIVIKWVQQDSNLLDLFAKYGGTDFENVMERAGNFVKDPQWLTAEWFVDACREEHGDIASLFLGWDESFAWLERQTENLRNAFLLVNNPGTLPPLPATVPPTPSTPDVLLASKEIDVKPSEANSTKDRENSVI